jgi:hypothetical protein
MGRFDLSQYEPVEDRLARFHDDHPAGRVLTVLEHYGDGEWIVRAEVYTDRDDARPAATGYAHEVTGQGNVNQTSALENCETSAVGRALANLGYAPKGKRPSREEMEKVERRAPKPGAKPDTANKVQAALTKAGVPLTALTAYVKAEHGVDRFMRLDPSMQESILTGLTKGVLMDDLKAKYVEATS